MALIQFNTIIDYYTKAIENLKKKTRTKPTDQNSLIEN